MGAYSLETPYFLIDKEALDNSVTDLTQALNQHWDNYIIGYSFKTNSLLWVLDYVRKHGFYAEVVSDDEYDLALATDFENGKIIYNGPPKSKKTFLEAIRNGNQVNIDSQREIEWLTELENNDSRNYEVGIRVNFDLEVYCPGSTVGGLEGGRFGFSFENGELGKAIDKIKQLKNTELVGLHLHFSTNTRSIEVYQMIARVACEVKRLYHLKLKYVNVGGGFFGGLEGKPQFKDYFKVIAEELEKEFDKNKTTLVVEPGASLIAAPIQFVTSVIDVKQTIRNRFVVTDGSRTNIDPRFRKESYFHRIAFGSQFHREVLAKQVVAGFTCMEDDRLFTLENHPELAVNDRVIYEKVGAYTMSLSPLFIKYFPAVYVKDDECVHKVRERWGVDEYLAKADGLEEGTLLYIKRVL